MQEIWQCSPSHSSSTPPIRLHHRTSQLPTPSPMTSRTCWGAHCSRYTLMSCPFMQPPTTMHRTGTHLLKPHCPCLPPIPALSPGAVQVDDGERPRLPPAHGPRLLVPRHLGPRGRKARAQVTSIQYLSFVMPLLSRTRKAALRSFGGLCLDWRLSYG